MICNNSGVCFGGEFPLIGYEELASALGLTAGTAMPERSWLKFQIDDKLLYVPKTAVRDGVSWLMLEELNLIYGDRTIEIDGQEFRVRLLRGADSDPYTGTLETGHDIVGTRNSEWSRLYYPVSGENIASYTGPKLASYTAQELGVTTGPGVPSICQERRGDTSQRVFRGLNSISYFMLGSSGSSNGRGWRPALELKTESRTRVLFAEGWSSYKDRRSLSAAYPATTVFAGGTWNFPTSGGVVEGKPYLEGRAVSSAGTQIVDLGLDNNFVDKRYSLSWWGRSVPSAGGLPQTSSFCLGPYASGLRIEVVTPGTWRFRINGTASNSFEFAQPSPWAWHHYELILDSIHVDGNRYQRVGSLYIDNRAMGKVEGATSISRSLSRELLFYNYPHDAGAMFYSVDSLVVAEIPNNEDRLGVTRVDPVGLGPASSPGPWSSIAGSPRDVISRKDWVSDIPSMGARYSGSAVFPLLIPNEVETAQALKIRVRGSSRTGFISTSVDSGLTGPSVVPGPGSSTASAVIQSTGTPQTFALEAPGPAEDPGPPDLEITVALRLGTMRSYLIGTGPDGLVEPLPLDSSEQPQLSRYLPFDRNAILCTGGGHPVSILHRPQVDATWARTLQGLGMQALPSTLSLSDNGLFMGVGSLASTTLFRVSPNDMSLEPIEIYPGPRYSPCAVNNLGHMVRAEGTTIYLTHLKRDLWSRDMGAPVSAVAFGPGPSILVTSGEGSTLVTILGLEQNVLREFDVPGLSEVYAVGNPDGGRFPLISASEPLLAVVSTDGVEVTVPADPNKMQGFASSFLLAIQDGEVTVHDAQYNVIKSTPAGSGVAMSVAGITI